MILSELVQALQAETVAPGPETEIRDGYTSDLLSDVVAHAPEDSILITVQSHRNTIAVATLAGIRAVLVCHQRPVPPDMLAAAQQEKIGIYRTSQNQFVASAHVHRLLFGM